MSKTKRSLSYLFSLTGIALLCACNSDAKKEASKPDSSVAKKTDTIHTLKKLSGKIFAPPEFGFKIVGYILDSRDSTEVAEKKFAQCNVIVYACAQVLKNNIVKAMHPRALETLVRRAHRNHSKAFLGISGEPSEFKIMTKSAAERSKCIAQIMQLIRQYKADGVDLDWEFPTKKEKTDKPFTLFAKELGDSCHVNGQYYFSCAVAPGINKAKRASAIEDELLTGPWVDWFNVMIYDAYDEDDPYVQHSKIAYNSFYYWLRVRKMSKDKAVLGMPIYGRPSGIPQGGHVLTFKTILKEGGNAYSDSAIIKTKKPVSIKDTSHHYTIYYDGIKTVKRKTIGAMRFGGGIMFWELGQDVNNKYSLITAAVNTAANKKYKSKH
ncbi:glycosyl hydrolase family 18 protein [Mucilaginibacter jinjuensis]|uniref:chitinase n=1 Tax=Mucilaginibacter jinjuensis TaxID=1176721 RepID=A0ABY7T185_9SPHI|nr:glycosyl hydrolase family 18 protein [Mucilaginibacter jinjuensis]WCT09979.1 glycosyl hydrolase family 18 protein [Mucilaginibacter jinjuensis]